MRRARPLQTFFQISIHGTEDALPDASQLAAFVEAYNRLYVILRIATDPSYDAERLVNRGYRLRQRDKLRVRSFRMSSPFHVEYIILATSGVVAAIKWLAPLGLKAYETIRQTPNIQAQTAKLEAEAEKARAEARKADAEARKISVETEKLLQDLSLVPLGERNLVNMQDYAEPEPELSLERAKEVSKDLSIGFAADSTPEELEKIFLEILPPQARLPLSHALKKIIKTGFVIVQVEVTAIQIADGDDANQSKE